MVTLLGTELNLFWVLISGMSLLGSVSYGYLVLRYGHPDIRTFSNEMEFGLSLTLGILMTVPSLFASIIIFESSLYTFPILGAVTGIFTLFLVAWTVMRSGAKLKVAVPIAGSPEKASAEPEPAPDSAEEEEIGEEIEEQGIEEVEELEEESEEEKEKTEEKKEEESEEVEEETEGKTEAEEELEEIEEEPQPAEKEEEKGGGGRKRYMKFRGEEEETSGYLSYEEEAEEEVSGEVGSKEVEEKTSEEGLGDLPSLESGNLASSGGGEEASGGVESILGDGGEEEVEGSISGELESIAGVSEEKDMKEEEKEEGEDKTKCPNCGAKNTTVIYCPNCGEGSCSNCAEKIKAKENFTIYECPHCGKQIIVRKND